MQRAMMALRNFIIKVSDILLLITIILLVIVIEEAICFVLGYFQLFNQGDINVKLFMWINKWNILDAPENMITSEYILQNTEIIKSRYEFFMNLAVALSGLALSIVTVVSYFKKLATIKRDLYYDTKKVLKGKDDLRLMRKYYKDADSIIVYSSTFSWVHDDKELRDYMEKVAEKRRLHMRTVNVEQVKKNIGNISHLLEGCLEETDKSELHCSLIKQRGIIILMYEYVDENMQYWVCTIKQKGEGKYLLEMLDELLK